MSETNNEDKITSEGMTKDNLSETAAQVEQLKAAILDRAAEVEDLHTVALEQEKAFQEELAALRSENESLNTKLADAEKARELAQSEINQMKEEAMLRERISKLEGEGLLKTEESSRIKQAEKVRAMTEEDFTSYLEDLLDVKIQTVNSFTKPVEVVQENVEATDAVKAEEVVASESISVSEDNLVSKVLESLAKPAAAETEEKTEMSSKEAASTVNSKSDVLRMTEGFKKIMSAELKQDSKNKGWL